MWSRSTARFISGAASEPRTRRARDGRAVDLDRAEARRGAEGPLEVVEQRPVDIGAHVHPLGEAGLHLAERHAHVLDAPCVARCGHAVLGDEDWNATRTGPGAP